MNMTFSRKSLFVKKTHKIFNFFIIQTKIVYLQHNFGCMKRIAGLIVFLIVLSYGVSVFSQDNKKEPVAIEVPAAPEMYVDDNKLYIKNAPVGKKVEVFTIIGNKIREIPITASEDVHVLNLQRAMYIFKMDGTIRKIVVR